MSGHNVSHANNKTKRRFLPNLQKASFYSEQLGRSVQLRVSARGIRTVEYKGGIDSFLLNAKDSKLDKKALQLKRQIAKAAQKQTKNTPAQDTPPQSASA